MENQLKNTEVLREIEKNKQLEGLEKYKTALKKVQFINEIKQGLGNQIKENPNRINIIKKSWYKKLLIYLKKLFTRF